MLDAEAVRDVCISIYRVSCFRFFPCLSLLYFWIQREKQIWRYEFSAVWSAVMLGFHSFIPVPELKIPPISGNLMVSAPPSVNAKKITISFCDRCFLKSLIQMVVKEDEVMFICLRIWRKGVKMTFIQQIRLIMTPFFDQKSSWNRQL